MNLLNYVRRNFPSITREATHGNLHKVAANLYGVQPEEISAPFVATSIGIRYKLASLQTKEALESISVLPDATIKKSPKTIKQAAVATKAKSAKILFNMLDTLEQAGLTKEAGATLEKHDTLALETFDMLKEAAQECVDHGWVKKAFLEGIPEPVMGGLKALGKGGLMAAGAAPIVYLVGDKMRRDATEDARNKALQVAAGVAAMATGVGGAKFLADRLGARHDRKQLENVLNPPVESIEKMSAHMFIDSILTDSDEPIAKENKIAAVHLFAEMIGE